VGTFDEEFFMYAEEVDLQYRMHLKGYERVVIDGPLIVHIEGGSMEPAARERLMLSGSLKFLRKHFPVKYGVYQVARLLSKPREAAAGRAGAQ
jgi:GT2 family glycosyltransferase